MKKIYLDYAATTPVAPEVEAAMRPYFLNKFGNAGSLHSFGQEAIAALDNSREVVASSMGANFREIIFTGSATEANNLALRGAVKKFKKEFPKIKNPEIIVSAIEHESVLETARDLDKEGVRTIYLPVSKNSVIDVKKLKKSLNERTILVSVMYANNEIGTVQPVAEIAEIIRNFREKSGNQKSSSLISNIYPLFHTDAVQAFQFLDCGVKKLGIDMMTVSAHKIYGPKGVGALYARQPCAINSIIAGGGQEFGMRSGTENIPLIVGFAKAAELTAKLREKESERIAKLRDYLWKEIKKICPRARTNPNSTQTYTEKFLHKSVLSQSKSVILPNFLNIYFPDYEAADLLTMFDLAGLAVSAGSACSARSAEPSYVLQALGAGRKQSSHSIRITLGRLTVKKDVDAALKTVRKLIK